MSIAALMDVPADDRKVDWLLKALQWAVQLEFATIPPYLCGLWSIIDPSHPVRGHLGEIVQQEMLHMALASNMLATLDGVPSIKGKAPTYPNPLPGGVRRQLVVWLAGFSRAMVRGVYMEIEYPEHGPIARYLDQSYPTIGSFYDAILSAFQRLPESAIKKTRQRQDGQDWGLGLFPINSVSDAVQAITTIKEQGEGTAQTPYPSNDPNDRAHYYRFAEIYHGHELIKTNGKWTYEGNEVSLPTAYPMAEVPSAGYPDDITRDFNNRYTDVVNLLQASWARDDGQTCLDKAVHLMPALGGVARNLMQKGLPDGSGSYGPDFRLVPDRDTPC
jgi:Ferritin-like